jgi:hypothetical protein
MPAQLSFTMCVCEPVAAGRAVRTFGMAEDVTKSKARTALVTGAGLRIGAMIALALARAGLCRCVAPTGTVFVLANCRR